MALADYEPFRQEVTSKNFKVMVRGLSLDDLSTLIRAHMDELNTLLDLARNTGEVFGTVSFLSEAILKAPGLCFDVIALAADEPSYSETARKLPVGTQITVIQTVLNLTLEDIGGPKSAVALVQKLLGRMKPVPASRAAT